MTARCVELVDEAGRRWHTMVVDAPTLPKSSWLGRVVARLSPQLLCAVAIVVVAIWVVSRLCRTKISAASPASSVNPSPPPVTTAVPVSLTTLPPGIGSWVGRDGEHRFGETLTTWEGTPIKPAHDDFYLAFNCGDPYKPLYLPSTLFKTAKEGDVIKFILDGKKYEWKLNNLASIGKPFEEHFARIQKDSQTYAPGRGSILTYEFEKNWPKDTLRIGDVPLSPQARKWNPATKAMEALAETDCLAMEEAQKNWGQFSPFYPGESHFQKQGILLALPREGGIFTLIADQGVIFFAGTFKEVKGDGDEEGLSELTLTNTFSFDSLIDSNTVALKSLRGGLGITYQPKQPV